MLGPSFLIAKQRVRTLNYSYTCIAATWLLYTCKGYQLSISILNLIFSILAKAVVVLINLILRLFCKDNVYSIKM